MSYDEREIINNVIVRLNSMGFKAVSTNYKISLTEHTYSVADIVIFDQDEAVYLVGEVKEQLPKQLDRFHPAVDQGFTVAQTLKAKYFFVADKFSIHWYEIKVIDQEFQIVENSNPPPLPEQPSVKPEIEYSGQISISDWSEVIWKMAAILRDSVPRRNISSVILELLLVKQYADEHDPYTQFKVIPGEREEETKGRIIQICQLASQSFVDVEIKYLSQIDASLIQTMVQVLQSYRFRSPEQSKYYQPHLIPALLETTEYEFATPTLVINLVSKLNEIGNAKRILDPASGVGNFLLTTAFEKRNKKDNILFVGVDINYQVSMLAKMGFLIRGVSDFHIINQDFLSEEAHDKLVSISPNKYDFIFCDPPMGKRYSEYEDWVVDFFENSQPFNLTIEQLFLIRILNMLGDEGTAAVLLPQGLLSLRSHKVFRKNLLRRANLLAIFDLPSNMFKYNQLQAHLLVLQAKRNNHEGCPTLMMRLGIDDQTSEEEKVNIIALAAEMYNYYRSSGKLKKEGRLQLSASLVDKFTDREDYRLDFAVYAPKYIGLLDRLERGPYKVIRLGDIAEIRLGIPRKYQAESGIPFLSASNITSDGLSCELGKFADRNIPSRSITKPGDLLIANVGRKYPVVIVPDEFPIATVDSSLIIIRIKPNTLIQSQYLHFILNHEITKTQLEHLSTGATIRRINPMILEDIKIPIIPNDKQRLIIEKMEQARKYRLLATKAEKDADKIVSGALGMEDDDGSQPEA
jgi:hypothetical protein